MLLADMRHDFARGYLEVVTGDGDGDGDGDGSGYPRGDEVVVMVMVISGDVVVVMVMGVGGKWRGSAAYTAWVVFLVVFFSFSTRVLQMIFINNRLECKFG